MGIFCHPVLPAAELQDLPVPSYRMAQLFYEFLSRYQAWRAAKRQELGWIVLLILLSVMILLAPYYLGNKGLTLSLSLFVVFYFSIRRCLETSERVGHLYVNVNILYHHLMGKLEVGFCAHEAPCRCVENFQRYVAEEYHIFLTGEGLR